MSLYERAIRSIQDEGLNPQTDTVLVTCGGDTDARAMEACGIRNATITNLDTGRRSGINGYAWLKCDAENLPYAADSFDWGFVNAGLHHCASPHRGLLELMRVCRKGVLIVEARDSAVMRLAVRLGFTSDYELEAVALADPVGGGIRNSRVPNFIYRWTEREIRKVIESAYPERENSFRFYYGLTLPAERSTMWKFGKRVAYRAASIIARAAFAILPKQGNQFAFAVLKTGRDKPWIARSPSLICLDPAYSLGFDPSRYVKEGDRKKPDQRRQEAACGVTGPD